MTMKKLMCAVASLLVATSTFAGGWGVGVSVNLGSPVVYTPAPVVYAPAPVVYTSPVYVPAPIYYAPRPVVVCPTPIGITYQTPVTVYFPSAFSVQYHHYHRR
jgi:hypothetical protein